MELEFGVAVEEEKQARLKLDYQDKENVFHMQVPRLPHEVNVH